MITSSSNRTSDSLIALRRILRATQLSERALAHSAGLTPAQLRVLQILGSGNGAGFSSKTLATRMGVSQATVTALVDRMVARGLVERVRSETDRRQTNITLTAAGENALEIAPDALQQRYVAAFENLQDWEQAQLIASLERIASMLDAEDIAPVPVLSSGDLKGEG